MKNIYTRFEFSNIQTTQLIILSWRIYSYIRYGMTGRQTFVCLIRFVIKIWGIQKKKRLNLSCYTIYRR